MTYRASRTRTRRIYVVAGNYQQARDWAWHWRLRPQDWQYVPIGSSDVLAGVRDVRVAHVGTWHQRLDLAHVRGRLLSVGSREVTETELLELAKKRGACDC